MDPSVAIVGVVLLLGFFLIFLFLGRSSPESALLAKITDQANPAGGEDEARLWLDAERIARPLGRFRALLGGGPNPELARRLMLAGYRKPFHSDVFVGVKLTLPVVASLAVAFWIKENAWFYFMLALVSGFFVPEFWLNHAITKRRECVRLSLPDALDLLAICMRGAWAWTRPLCGLATS